MLNFGQPFWLFGLLLLPLLALIHWQQVQRESQALDDFAREPLLAKMNVKPRQEARLWKGLLMIAALGCGLMALSQPRWGGGGNESSQVKEGSLVIALDVSKSMLAKDVGSESRLAAAQRLLAAVTPQLTGWKVGVVAFAGQGQALVPLTTDHSAVETLLERARPGQAPGIGSNLEAGLKTAHDLFQTPGRRVVLLLTDGEELSGKAANAVNELKQAKIEVLAVGFGSGTGSPIPASTDLWGNPAYLEYRGEKVVSKLHENTLKQIVNDTGGAYIYAGSPAAATQVSARLVRPGALKLPQKADKATEQGYELFQIPLALALLLTLVEAGWNLWGRPRREMRFADELRSAMGRKRGGTDRLRRTAVGLFLVFASVSQTAWTWYPSWLPNREAAKAYETGDFARANALLSGAVKSDPDNFRLHYNLANVYYQQGSYAVASNMYQRAWDMAPEAERPAISYNLGNAHFRQAEASDNDPKGYQRAIAEYERVLKDRPKDADARHNLEVAKKRLKEAKKKQSNAGQGQGGQPQGQGSNQGAVGQQTPHKPLPEIKNLPSEAEVEALLKALESDERQRQAEQSAENQSPEQGGALGQNLLQQALGSLDMQKDW
jgi:Ca-activated chloride channel family protein